MVSKFAFIDEEFLRKEYIVPRLTDEQLAQKLNCSSGTIKNKRRLFGIAANKGHTLLNKTFEKLIVVEEAGRNHWKQILWKCRCQCGNETIVHGRNLENGDTKSCGCLKNRTNEDNPKWKGYKTITGSFWCHVKRRAINRELDWSLTKEEAFSIFEKQNFVCYFTGLDIKAKNASIDRLDSNKGYVLDNIVWTHKDVNVMKWDFSVDYFFKLCNLVVTKRDSKDSKDSKDSNVQLFEKNINWRGHGNISAKQWGDIQRSAKSSRRGKNRNLLFDLKIEDAWEIFLHQHGLCAITGIPLYFPKSMKEFSLKTASLDRKDSSSYYFKENVWWVHKDINKMKYKFSFEYFVFLCELVVKNSKKEIF